MSQTRCVEIDFPGKYQGMTRLLRRQTVAGPIAWMGSLMQDAQDANGLMFRRNRYYDASSGRFTQEDPIGLAGGVNAYGFAGGDPVSYSDPYGLCKPWPQCIPEEWRAIGNEVRAWFKSDSRSAATVRFLVGAEDCHCVMGVVVPSPFAGPLAVEGSAPVARSWPSTPAEMDEMLGVEGTRIPDAANTPGRNKVVWRPNENTKITYEQHPYHPDAPDWHRAPHWHLDTPATKHARFLPGDPLF